MNCIVAVPDVCYFTAYRRHGIHSYSVSCENFWLKGGCSKVSVSDMDFQLARNLSAIARAQEEISQAILHIDSTADCLNREIIMAAASSEATEQLLASAKTNLLQVKNILVRQSEEGANRLRDAHIAFITERHERPSSTSASHESQSDSHRSMLQQSGGQSCITERVTPSEGHSYEHTAIRGSLWRDDESL